MLIERTWIQKSTYWMVPFHEIPIKQSKLEGKESEIWYVGGRGGCNCVESSVKEHFRMMELFFFILIGV